MSGKLDQSLDDILSSRPRGGRAVRRGGRRAATAATKVTTRAPVGGVQKATKPVKGSAKAAAPSGPAVGTGDSKIIVSNLPSDVSEQQIKEYFNKSVGPVRRVMLTYGPTGVSRGVATIIFSKPGDANNAAVQLNGMLVDKRPMRIEVVLDANKPAPVKALSERIGQPKGAQPKSAAKPKPATEKATTNGEARGGRAGRGRGAKRGRNAGRPKAKTADELDAEMMDYFDANAASGTAAATDGVAAAPAANGTAAAGGDDLGMEEIS